MGLQCAMYWISCFVYNINNAKDGSSSSSFIQREELCGSRFQPSAEEFLQYLCWCLRHAGAESFFLSEVIAYVSDQTCQYHNFIWLIVY